MLDDRTLRKKVFVRLLGSPLTIAPFLLGMTTMMTTWAMNWHPSLGVFAGLAGALGSLGAYLSQALMRGEKLTREAAAVLEHEANAERQKALDALDRQLTEADADPRPETALRELRALLKAFEEGEQEAAWNMNQSSAYEVNSMVRQLFDRCVESLRQSDRLWQTAEKLQTAAARKPILQQREKLIHEVTASIEHLSGTLVALQTLDRGTDNNKELARLRGELDASLKIARTVEERVNALVSEVSEVRNPTNEEKI